MFIEHDIVKRTINSCDKKEHMKIQVFLLLKKV